MTTQRHMFARKRNPRGRARTRISGPVFSTPQAGDAR